MRRKINNPHEARRCLRAAERAGLTAGEWAREHGIDGRSLNAWRMNLARRARVEHRTDFEPRLVELVPGPGPGREARYIVRIRDITIEVGTDFHEESLVRLVRALRAC
jgi:hypothetical protein